MSSSSNSDGGLYLLRVACPGGVEVEVDHAGYAGREQAVEGATRLATLLSPDFSYDFGIPEVAEDLRRTLGVLGVDPAACRVEVVTPWAGAGVGERMGGYRLAGVCPVPSRGRVLV
jgi:hypothetical protein